MAQTRTFDEIESRIDEISERVSNEETSLDEALSLFEEAVKLGMQACEITDSEVATEIELSDDAALDDLKDGSLDENAQVTEESIERESSESTLSTTDIQDEEGEVTFSVQ